MLGTFRDSYWFSRPRPATRDERLRASMSGRINRLPFANHPGFKWGDRTRALMQKYQVQRFTDNTQE